MSACRFVRIARRWIVRSGAIRRTVARIRRYPRTTRDSSCRPMRVSAVRRWRIPLSFRDRHPMIRDMKRNPRQQRSSKGPPAGPVAVPRVHLNAFRGLPDVLASFNVPSEPILRTAGLTRQDLEDPERSAPFPDMDRLIGLCVRRTKCAHFGLLLGQHVNLQSFGIAGRLARHATSVGAALQGPGCAFRVARQRGCTQHRHPRRHGDIRLRHTRCRCSECGPGLRPIRRLDAERHASALWHELEAGRNPAAAKAADGYPSIPADSGSAAALRRSAVRRLCFRHSGWRDRSRTRTRCCTCSWRITPPLNCPGQEPMLHGDVRRTIRLLLPARRCSRADVAQRLGIHPRTLGRRLQESGTTFQALLDDTRAQIAKQLLLRHALDGRAYRCCAGVRGSDGVHPGLRSLDGPHPQ